jgi:hypothetical protein
VKKATNQETHELHRGRLIDHIQLVVKDLALSNRIVDESHAPSHWTLADRAGNRVCICAWPDGPTQKLRPA